MNSWLTRFRISAARDEGRPLPESLRQKINRSADLREFEEKTSALENALRTSRPEETTSPFLTASIMRAVRESSKPAAKPLAWITTLRATVGATALLVLALFGFWWSNRGPVAKPAQVASTLSLPDTPAQLSDTVTRTLPLATVAPLNDELARVNLDLTNTAQFLLANVP